MGGFIRYFLFFMYVISSLQKYVSLFALFTLSFFSIAGVSAQNKALDPITGTIESVGNIVNLAVIITVSLAFLFFFWYLVRYVLHESDADAKEKAKKGMIWSVVAMFVITSVWGLIAFIRALVGVDAGTAEDIQIPGVEFN